MKWLACLLLALASCKEGMKQDELAIGTPVPELAGENYDGAKFRLSERRGRTVVLFFGYTFCPDVCQMTLFRLNQVMKALGPDAGKVEVVFVTVDPQRDTKEKLAQHLSAFNENFYGVRASDLLQTMDAYRLVAEGRAPEANGYYAIDHTGTIFIIDRAGTLQYRAPHTAEPEELLREVRKHL
jgi:protein SCO1/2